MQTCDECYWFWTGIAGPVCHHDMTSEKDMEGYGMNCPWFDPKDKEGEKIELPEDIWN